MKTEPAMTFLVELGRVLLPGISIQDLAVILLIEEIATAPLWDR